MKEDTIKEKNEGWKRKAEESLGLSPRDLPVELLSRILAHLTDAKDIVNVHLVNSKFHKCASWDGVTGISFVMVRYSKGRRLSMHSAMANLYFESGWLQDGILRYFWKNCVKLNEIAITDATVTVSSADVRRLLSEILSLQQEMPRKIKSLTNEFPDVVGSSGLLEVWQDSLRRICLRWGDCCPMDQLRNWTRLYRP